MTHEEELRDLGFRESTVAEAVADAPRPSLLPVDLSQVSFVVAFHELACVQGEINKYHGFWNDPVNVPRSIALMHSELSEALEGDRHGNPPSDHIPEYTALEEELADVVLRIMELSARMKLNTATAIVAKLRFNHGRPKMHGGKAY